MTKETTISEADNFFEGSFGPIRAAAVISQIHSSLISGYYIRKYYADSSPSSIPLEVMRTRRLYRTAAAAAIKSVAQFDPDRRVGPDMLTAQWQLHQRSPDLPDKYKDSVKSSFGDMLNDELGWEEKLNATSRIRKTNFEDYLEHRNAAYASGVMHINRVTKLAAARTLVNDSYGSRKTDGSLPCLIDYIGIVGGALNNKFNINMPEQQQGVNEVFTALTNPKLDRSSKLIVLGLHDVSVDGMPKRAEQ